MPTWESHGGNGAGPCGGAGQALHECCARIGCQLQAAMLACAASAENTQCGPAGPMVRLNPATPAYVGIDLKAYSWPRPPAELKI